MELQYSPLECDKVDCYNFASDMVVPLNVAYSCMMRTGVSTCRGSTKSP